MDSREGGTVPPNSVEARWIRAALTSDGPERRRIAREELPGGPPLQVIPIACAVAARRLFGPQWDRRLITTFAQRVVDRSPAAAGLLPRDVESVLRGMTGETELLTGVPGEALAEITLASLLGLADELALDDEGVDVLLVEAERETAAVAAVAEPPDADKAAVPDGDRWRRTFERYLSSDDFVPRAHPVARPPRPFPAEKGRYTEPASKAGRYLRHLLRGESGTGLQASEVPQVDLLRVARLAFTVAVRSYYLYPDPDLAETMALACATKAHHWPELNLMKAEYLTRTIFGEKLPLDGITNRDVYPSCVFMLNTIIDAWDGDDAAVCSVLADAEEGVALRGNALSR
ncbi:hypothetical protein [Actinoplanes sp. NPDC026619]|uniref:hypothetical protein n=1 Tax=Actinoplanes sp. NPDC026619 TaxID=3155798 RepID=UPI00340B40A6